MSSRRAGILMIPRGRHRKIAMSICPVQERTTEHNLHGVSQSIHHHVLPRLYLGLPRHLPAVHVPVDLGQRPSCGEPGQIRDSQWSRRKEEGYDVIDMSICHVYMVM